MWPQFWYNMKDVMSFVDIRLVLFDQDDFIALRTDD